MTLDFNKPLRWKHNRVPVQVFGRDWPNDGDAIVGWIGPDGKPAFRVIAKDDNRFENYQEPIVHWQNVYDRAGTTAWWESKREATSAADIEETRGRERIGLLKRARRDRADKGVIELVPEAEWNDE